MLLAPRKQETLFSSKTKVLLLGPSFNWFFFHFQIFVVKRKNFVLVVFLVAVVDVLLDLAVTLSV